MPKWYLFTSRGWTFYINSGEHSRKTWNEPHVHAQKSGRTAYVYFDGRIKEGRGKLHGNDQREIEKAFEANRKHCRREWNRRYPMAAI